jgi:hypothetical protein
VEVAARFAPDIGLVTKAALLAGAAVITVLGTPSSTFGQENEEEIDCASVCRVFPDRAPPKCGCEADITRASADDGDTFEDPVAREVFERMERNWREQTAHVDDYTIVQTSSIGGPPAVLYYEKEIVEGRPEFRQVSPGELSLREAEASGQDVNLDAADVMGQMVRNLTRGSAGTGSQGGGAQSGSGAATNQGETQPGGELNELLTGVADFLEAGLALKREMNSADWDGGLLEDRKSFYRMARDDGRRCVQRRRSDGSLDSPSWGMSCRESAEYEVLRNDCRELTVSEFEHGRRVLDIQLGTGFEDYYVKRMSVTVCGDDAIPMHQFVVLYPREYFGQEPETYATDAERDLWRFRLDNEAKMISKWNFDYDVAEARFIPRRSLLETRGLAVVGERFVEVLITLQNVLVNEGPPTRETMLELLEVAMDRTEGAS